MNYSIKPPESLQNLHALTWTYLEFSKANFSFFQIHLFPSLSSLASLITVAITSTGFRKPCSYITVSIDSGGLCACNEEKSTWFTFQEQLLCYVLFIYKYTFFLYIYILVSSKVEFLLHKKLWILFYFDHTYYTNVDRRLMRYLIRYNWVRKRARWSEPCVLGCYPGILLARDFQSWSREKKLSFSPYNKSFIDRACSVKIAGHYPLFFCVFVPDFVSVR